jgi:uncharacterized protein YraI
MARRFAAFFALVIASLLIGLVFSGATIQAQSGLGTNWTGNYYSDSNFTNLALTRIDPVINFVFGQAAPVGTPAGFLPDNFSIRWTGAQTFSQSGTYRFTIARDEDAQVTFNGQVIIPFAGGVGNRTYSADIPVVAGTYNIQVDYRELTGDAYVQFFWTLLTPGAGGTPGITASPTRTALPAIPPGALTATVIRAAVLNVRDAPSLGGGRLGRILRGETYQVVGRDENARWFLLQLGGYQGWAWGYYLAITGNEFNAPIRSPFGTIGVPAGVQDTGVVGQSQSTLRLRAQPNVAATQTGRVTWGGFLPIIGRTADGFWYQVVWKGTIGWVYSPFVRITQGDLNAVPVTG